MELKSTLKNLKLNESLISMFLGLFVIVLVGFLVLNYFRQGRQGEITSTGEEDVSLPTIHMVQKGEDLWSISENYFDTGYNWVDIAAENEIDNPNLLAAGQKITIPNVTPILLDEDSEVISQTDTPIPTLRPTNTLVPTATPTPLKQPMKDDNKMDSTPDRLEPKIGDTYTVERGDNLWNIAERAYGNGFRWVDIAEANDLVNPSLIHRGNQFIIPR